MMWCTFHPNAQFLKHLQHDLMKTKPNGFQVLLIVLFTLIIQKQSLSSLTIVATFAIDGKLK